MQKITLLTSTLALSLALASCGSSNLNQTKPLSTQELAASSAAAINDEATNAATSLTAQNTMSDLSFSSVSLASAGTVSMQATPPNPSGERKPGSREPGFKPGGQQGDKCVTVSSTTDTDKDGVPDNALLTFDCARDSLGYSFTRKGTVQITDPSNLAGEGGFDKVISLTEVRSNKTTGKSVTETRTGERHPRRNGDKIVQNHDIKILRSVTGESDAEIHNVWKLEFNATTAGSITKGALLPAGSMSINGTHTVTRDGKTKVYTLATPSALSYDPSCDDDIKYVAGTLQATLSGDTTGSLEIVYGACGTDPTITKSGEAVNVKFPVPGK